MNKAVCCETCGKITRRKEENKLIIEVIGFPSNKVERVELYYYCDKCNAKIEERLR